MFRLFLIRLLAKVFVFYNVCIIHGGGGCKENTCNMIISLVPTYHTEVKNILKVLCVQWSAGQRDSERARQSHSRFLLNLVTFQRKFLKQQWMYILFELRSNFSTIKVAV